MANANAYANLTFHMNNEMYLGETWDFTSATPTTTPTPGGGGVAVTPQASLKTRAVMWGTEAHENWYLLDYHPEWNMMFVYYCAYTDAVRAYDSMAMVLVKQLSLDNNDQNKLDVEEEGATTDYGSSENNSNLSVELTAEQTEYYERKARELLGDFHGRLQRIRPCQT